MYLCTELTDCELIYNVLHIGFFLPEPPWFQILGPPLLPGPRPSLILSSSSQLASSRMVRMNKLFSRPSDPQVFLITAPRWIEKEAICSSLWPRGQQEGYADACSCTEGLTEFLNHHTSRAITDRSNWLLFFPSACFAKASCLVCKKDRVSCVGEVRQLVTGPCRG